MKRIVKATVEIEIHADEQHMVYQAVSELLRLIALANSKNGGPHKCKAILDRGDGLTGDAMMIVYSDHQEAAA